MKKYNVVVVGVGAVGVEMLRILKKRNFPINNLKVLARSERDIKLDGDIYRVKKINPLEFEGFHIALFAGTEGEKGASITFAKEAIKRGCVVIDNGTDFRLEPDVPLVIPEVNSQDLNKHSGLIASPNCSTIQMVLALAPIYRLSQINRVIVSTYQAVSGAGQSAKVDLFNQLKELFEKFEQIDDLEKGIQSWFEGKKKEQLNLLYPIGFNIIPQIGKFEKLEFTTEEWKTVKETQKILHDEKIEISSTCVRVPILNSHSQSIYIETEKELSIEDIKQALQNFNGISLIDDVEANTYPMPIETSGKDDCFVGRIRKDIFRKNGYWLWCVSDNLRKGAALNTIQIAEYLIKHFLNTVSKDR